MRKALACCKEKENSRTITSQPQLLTCPSKTLPRHIQPGIQRQSQTARLLCPDMHHIAQDKRIQCARAACARWLAHSGILIVTPPENKLLGSLLQGTCTCWQRTGTQIQPTTRTAAAAARRAPPPSPAARAASAARASPATAHRTASAPCGTGALGARHCAAQIVCCSHVR